MSISFTNKFQQRWFVLDGVHLKYSHTKVENDTDEFEAVLDISKTTKIELISALIFELHFSEGDSLRLQGRSPENVQVWVGALEAVLRKVRPAAAEEKEEETAKPALTRNLSSIIHLRSTQSQQKPQPSPTPAIRESNEEPIAVTMHDKLITMVSSKGVAVAPSYAPLVEANFVESLRIRLRLARNTERKSADEHGVTTTGTVDQGEMDLCWRWRARAVLQPQYYER